MTDPDVIEGTATDEQAPSGAVARRPALDIAPAATAQDLVARLDVIRSAAETAMREGVDYGRIPGIDKPTLFKPGAEKLSVLFQLDVQLANEQTWGPGEHLTVTSRATVYNAPTGARLGYGEGVCSTRERKYAKRKQERTCPTCGQPAIIKGKAEYGGGWVCWNKKGGCNAKFRDGDQAIEGQETSEIDNPDLPDLWNTVTKMAEKRARVDAVLAVTGASALFTQDVEDSHVPAPDVAAAPAQPEQPPASERLLSEEQWSKLLNAFQQSGNDLALLTEALDKVGAPEGEKPTDRVRVLTAQQASNALRHMRAQIKARAAA